MSEKVERVEISLSVGLVADADAGTSKAASA